MRIAISVLFLSAFVLFLSFIRENEYSAMVPMMFLYSLSTIALLLGIYLGRKLKIGLKLLYPISFIFSLIVLILSVSWLSENPIIETGKSIFLDRKDITAMSDPYIIANLITYILLITRTLIS